MSMDQYVFGAEVNKTVLTYRTTILALCIHAVNYGSYRVLLYFCSLGSENVAYLARNGYKIFFFVWGDPIMYRTSSYTHTHIAYTEAYWTHIGHEQPYTLYRQNKWFVAALGVYSLFFVNGVITVLEIFFARVNRWVNYVFGSIWRLYNHQCDVDHP